MRFKLGKKAARRKSDTLMFSDYRTSAIVKVPTSFGHQSLIGADWGMLGNDSVGDCAIAGPDHETMLLTKIGGNPAKFTTENALSDYTAISGYNPGDPNSDTGCDVHDVADYRVKTGMLDASGARHKIGAYVSITPGNWEHFLEALYLFNAVGIGLQLPESAQDQFGTGQPWTVVRGSPIEGGHYVSAVGKVDADPIIITWGAEQRITKKFFEKFCDECYGYLSTEQIVSGKTLEGFDLAQLQADLEALGG